MGLIVNANHPNGGKGLVAPVLRVSTPKQAKEGYSLAMQLDMAREIIARHGYSTDPSLILEDDGFMGDDWSRPAINQGLEWVRTGKVKGLAFLDTDRFARDVLGGLAVIREIRKAGGTVLFGDMPEVNAATEAEWALQLNFKLTIGQYQKAKTKALSRWAVAKKLKQGDAFGGHARYGYRWKGKLEGSRGEIVVDPSEAPVARLIFELYDQGYSLRAICRELRVRNIPPRLRNWSTRLIASMLADEIYISACGITASARR